MRSFLSVGVLLLVRDGVYANLTEKLSLDTITAKQETFDGLERHAILIDCYWHGE